MSLKSGRKREEGERSVANCQQECGVDRPKRGRGSKKEEFEKNGCKKERKLARRLRPL